MSWRVGGVRFVAQDRDVRSTGGQQRIGDLDRSLLLQCRTSQVTQAAEVADRPGSGLVVTVDRGNQRGCLARARHLLEVDHYRQPVLLDAARYVGPDRLTASASFDDRWIGAQRDLGLPVLTDSGYLAPADTAGCLGILERAARLGDAIALLPMHPAWLADPTARQHLVRYVEVVGVPVAIVVERAVAPVDPVEVVRGLLELLRCAVPVLLLRADLAALGALGSGAVAAAVGLDPTLRGLDPGPRGSDPRGAEWRRQSAGTPSVLIRQCLSYQSTVEVEAAIRRYPDNGMWHCGCPTCGGRDLTWLVRRPDAGRAGLVLGHSVDVLLGLRAEMTGPCVQLNQWSWRARCATATSRLREVGWERLPMLTHWQGAITLPAISRLSIPVPRRSTSPTTSGRFSRADPPRAGR
ncbi:hypothetical protein [Plantactinospora sp. B24E8]|uniref:hypothetical protein n=1 Tax=Plantactinospora sp. B24E8 TaxID=3153567 RepID=UPI00325C4963